jgi:hypothetical protein
MPSTEFISVHNGESKRKAAAWDWIKRVASVGTWPLFFGVAILWADTRHITKEWQDHVRENEIAHRTFRDFMVGGGNRWTREQALEDRALLIEAIYAAESRSKDYVDKKIEEFPLAAWLQEDIKEIKEDVKALRRDVDRISKDN